jgi:O-antigen/teichoic acid export membrane protein
MIKKLRNSKFSKDLTFSYFTKCVIVGFGFIQLFLLNRYFGIESYGQLAIIISTAGIFSALLTARSSEAIIRFFTREMLKNNLINAKFVLFIGFCIDLITALLMIGFTYLFSDFVAINLIKDVELNDDFFLYSFVTFFGFLRGTFLGYFQSKEMFFLINKITLFELIVKLIGLFLIVYLLPNNALKNVIWVFVIASISSLLFSIIAFYKSFKEEFRNTIFSFNKVILKEYFFFNTNTFISSSLKGVNNNIDTLLIAHFLSVQVVGLYQFIKKILSPMVIFSEPFPTLVYSKLVHFYERKEVDKFVKVIFKNTLIIFLFTLPYILIGYLFIENIFILMNVKLSPETPTLYVLMSVFIVVTNLLWWVRVFSNVVNPNYSLYMNIFATIFQLTITILATNLFGVNGLIISMILMYVLIGIFWIIKMWNYVRKTIYIY